PVVAGTYTRIECIFQVEQRRGASIERRSGHRQHLSGNTGHAYERFAVARVAVLRLMTLVPDEQVHPVGIHLLEILIEAAAWIAGGVLLAWFWLAAFAARFLPKRAEAVNADAFACP